MLNRLHQSLGKEGANFASRLAGPVGAYRQLPSSYSPATRSHAVSSSNRGGGGSGGGGGLSGSSYHLHAKHGRVDSLRRDGIRPATTATVAGGEGGASSISAPSLGGSNRWVPGACTSQGRQAAGVCPGPLGTGAMCWMGAVACGRRPALTCSLHRRVVKTHGEYSRVILIHTC